MLSKVKKRYGHNDQQLMTYHKLGVL